VKFGEISHFRSNGKRHFRFNPNTNIYCTSFVVLKGKDTTLKSARSIMVGRAWTGVEESTAILNFKKSYVSHSLDQKKNSKNMLKKAFFYIVSRFFPN
jgi:hypothetical protein